MTQTLHPSHRYDVPEPAAMAKAAGLVYVTDDMPGLRRKRSGKGFSYYDAAGALVKGRSERKRLKALAIPPAWTDVWICPDPTGHIQATGYDERGRKQYRYHPRWRTVRDRMKFLRLIAFGHALPDLRRTVDEDLGREGMPRRKALAAAIRLLDHAAIRIGNPQYAAQNNTFGLTTLRCRHVERRSEGLHIAFRGKGGADIEVTVKDDTLARVLEEALTMPGWNLFQYRENGEKRTLDPMDVNEYLRAGLGGPFSAKDFRTWTGTTLAVNWLIDHTSDTGAEPTKSHWLAAVDAVAATLHNTRTVARNSYIHPDIETLYLSGDFFNLVEGLSARAEELDRPGRRPGERVTLALLEAMSVRPVHAEH